MRVRRAMVKTTAPMDLPPEVIAHIDANRKIDAIKALRESRGIGLKEAKEAVDAHIARANPGAASTGERGRGQHRLFFIALLVVGVYVAYRLLG